MGELAEYYIILSEVKYDDDPMKFGRIKCEIPGVIHVDTTMKEAMPWVRPYKMYCYQTFTRPIVGQKIWVLISKTNYNEFWWFPLFETIDLVQNYLNEHYDFQPDVFNARNGALGDAIFTYDDKNGYRMKIEDDFIDFYPDRTFHLNIHDCDIHVTPENTLWCGGDESAAGDYEPAVRGYQCVKLRENLQKQTIRCAAAAATDSCPTLSAELEKLAQDYFSIETKNNFLCEKCHVN